jgi:hypothetical protein
MMAQNRDRLAPVWNERRGRSHGLSEDKAQRGLDKPGPESWRNMRARSLPDLVRERGPQTENEDPQPHVVDTFGLRMIN